MAICGGGFSFLLGLNCEPDSPSEETAELSSQISPTVTPL